MQFDFNISKKIVSTPELIYLVQSWKAKGFTVGFTNGCFDILHKGHVAYIENAKKHCSYLVIGINADQSVKKLNKGKNRPINNENDRAFVLAALLHVDAVVIFDDETPYEIIHKILPDFLFKGGDYDVNCTDPKNPKYIVGSDLVNANGGKVISIPFVEGYSTTAIIEKSQSC